MGQYVGRKIPSLNTEFSDTAGAPHTNVAVTAFFVCLLHYFFLLRVRAAREGTFSTQAHYMSHVTSYILPL